MEGEAEGLVRSFILSTVSAECVISRCAAATGLDNEESKSFVKLRPYSSEDYSSYLKT